MDGSPRGGPSIRFVETHPSKGPSVTDDAHFSSLTDVGKVRDHNEDTTAVVNPPNLDDRASKGVLGVVADGMGGHEAGEVASSRAVDAFVKAYYSRSEPDPARALQIAVKAANDAVRGIQAVRAGTTLVAAAVIGDDAHVLNVGDSRAYLVTPDAIRQISRDHSWVQDQVAAGHLTHEQARVHPRRNVLTRCLGGDAYVQGDYFHEVMCEGCSIVLCSDGLHGMVSDKEIGDVVRRADPDRASLDLIALANKHGGHDNISVVILRKGGVEGLETGFKTVRADAPRSKAMGWILGVVALLAVCLGAVMFLTTRPLVNNVGSSGVVTSTVEASSPPSPVAPEDRVVVPAGRIAQAMIQVGSHRMVLSSTKVTSGGKAEILLSAVDGKPVDGKRVDGKLLGTRVLDTQAVADDAHSVWVLTDYALFRIRLVDGGAKPDVNGPLAGSVRTGLLSVGNVDAKTAYRVTAPATSRDALFYSSGADQGLKVQNNLWVVPVSNPKFVKWSTSAAGRPPLMAILETSGRLSFVQQIDGIDESVQRLSEKTDTQPLGSYSTDSRITTPADQSSVALWSPASREVKFFTPGGPGLALHSTEKAQGAIRWLAGTTNAYVALVEKPGGGLIWWDVSPTR